MTVTALLVASVNGKITNGSDTNIYSWTSAEDQDLFFAAVRAAQLIVMGRHTWQAARDKIVLKPGTLRVVLTVNPDKYAAEAVPGQLEFSSESPAALVQRLSELGYQQLLLVGGAQVLRNFLQDGLLDYLQLTIEPFLFGQGTTLLPETSLSVPLELLEVRQLNERGTLMVRYGVGSCTAERVSSSAESDDLL